MADMAVFFLVAAAVTLFGFLASLLFERFRFPDAPVLLGLGLILGPINRLGVSQGWGSPDVAAFLSLDNLRPMTPFVAAIALIAILFESGLKLDFKSFRGAAGPAAAVTAPLYILTVGGVAAVAISVWAMDLLVALALGIAVVNVCQTVANSVLTRLRISDELRAAYTMEMALYDLISIPLLVSLLVFAQGGGAQPGLFAQSFAILVFVSVGLGAAFGLAWSWFLARLGNVPYAYMLTFGGLLTLYALGDYLGGSGAVAVLLFGLILGNRERFKFLHEQSTVTQDRKVVAFHDEITFFVRTFFFLFLGVNFSLGGVDSLTIGSPLPYLDRLGAKGVLFVAAGLIVATIVAARWIVVRLLAVPFDPARRALFPVFGRGLDTAVLATFPFIQAAYTPGTAYYAMFSPWEGIFLNTGLLVILSTVLLSGILVWRYENQPAPHRTPARDDSLMEFSSGRRPGGDSTRAAAGRRARR